MLVIITDCMLHWYAGPKKFPQPKMLVYLTQTGVWFLKPIQDVLIKHWETAVKKILLQIFAVLGGSMFYSVM